MTWFITQDANLPRVQPRGRITQDVTSLAFAQPLRRSEVGGQKRQGFKEKIQMWANAHPITPINRKTRTIQ
jgi:hypothetical protein